MSRKNSRERSRAHHAKRRSRRKASYDNVAWRSKPPTQSQITKLRRMGLPMMPNATRGQVGDAIRNADPFPKQPRAQRKAPAKSTAATKPPKNVVDLNPAAKWRFGIGQSAQEELAEFKKAKADGLENLYIELQRRTLSAAKAA